ncbi:unnamed protein product, partial [Discosporangium mesarthrocarpum]
WFCYEGPEAVAVLCLELSPWVRQERLLQTCIIRTFPGVLSILQDSAFPRQLVETASQACGDPPSPSPPLGFDAATDTLALKGSSAVVNLWGTPSPPQPPQAANEGPSLTVDALQALGNPAPLFVVGEEVVLSKAVGAWEGG